MLSHEFNHGIKPEVSTSESIAWLSQRAWVEIDLGALAENVKQLRAYISSQTQLMAIVKADAYGHGAVAVAQTVLLAGADWLGVATVPEGIQLRENGITAPILVLGAAQTREQIQAIASWDLQPTLCSPKQALVFAETLEQGGFTDKLPVHIKLDTGMSRLGIDWQQAGEFVQLITSLPKLEIASVYSHLATADSLDPTIMQLQQQRFEQAIAQLDNLGLKVPKLHLANSAGTLADKSLHYDMVRPGLAIYGYYPAPHFQGRIHLQPVLGVKARITHIKEIQGGTGVSYGYSFIAPQDMRIAVVGIGYADGVPRNLSNKLQVIFQGQLLPQIGTITMDQMMIDISHVPTIQVGDVVTLLGRDRHTEITAEDWATQLGTISWEILCGFKHRLPRVTVNY